MRNRCRGVCHNGCKFVTHDLHYNVSFLNDKAQVSLSVLNLFDEDPPQTFTNLNYDPYTASAFGRMIKVGVTYTLGGS